MQLGSAPFATSARMVSPSLTKAAKCSGLMPKSIPVLTAELVTPQICDGSHPSSQMSHGGKEQVGEDAQ